MMLGDVARAVGGRLYAIDPSAYALCHSERSEESSSRLGPEVLSRRAGIRCAQNDGARASRENGAGALGESNDATANITIHGVTTDSREAKAGDLFFAIRGPNHDGHRYLHQAAARGCVGCVVDSACLHAGPPPLPAIFVDDTVAALGSLAGYYRRNVMRIGTTVIAVTGSNGKTTTKNMIDHVLRSSLKGFASPKSFNNKFGVPLTLLLADADDQYVVCEIGTNAPGEISHLAAIAQPHVGVITSIGEAHLEGLGGIEGVAAEKGSLLDHVQPVGLAVINVDRPQIRPYAERCRHARVVTIGTHPSAKLTVRAKESSLSHTVFELEGRYRIELPMPGAHHATNAAAAFAVARWLGVDCAQIIEAFRTFVPADGRTRRIEANGLTIIDDAYNANPASVGAAVETLGSIPQRRRVFVLGDMRELGSDGTGLHEEVVRRIADRGINVLIGVGEAVAKAVSSIADRHLEVHLFDDADQASGHLGEILREGDAVWIKGSRAMQLDKVVKALSTPALGRREACAHELVGSGS